MNREDRDDKLLDSVMHKGLGDVMTIFNDELKHSAAH